jgi:hypothetical protein
MRHVVFDEIGRALDAADFICLVASASEITMADLPVIFFAGQLTALTDMHRNMNFPIVRHDGSRTGTALGCRDLPPEMIEHGIRRRLPVKRAPTHFSAGDEVDAG